MIYPAKTSDLLPLVGQTLGPTGWYAIDQAKVDRFAEATEDHQWIHVDPERAAEGPFGGTVAHGLFTLSLGPRFTEELVDFGGFAQVVNYGYQRVRFPAPLRVGSELRMSLELKSLEPVDGGAQLTTVQAFEVEGGNKPVCVAESLARFVDRRE